jgi:hypothetical protein
LINSQSKDDMRRVILIGKDNNSQVPLSIPLNQAAPIGLRANVQLRTQVVAEELDLVALALGSALSQDSGALIGLERHVLQAAHQVALQGRIHKHWNQRVHEMIDKALAEPPHAAAAGPKPLSVSVFEPLSFEALHSEPLSFEPSRTLALERDNELLQQESSDTLATVFRCHPEESRLALACKVISCRQQQPPMLLLQPSASGEPRLRELHSRFQVRLGSAKPMSEQLVVLITGQTRFHTSEQSCVLTLAELDRLLNQELYVELRADRLVLWPCVQLTPVYALQWLCTDLTLL